MTLLDQSTQQTSSGRMPRENEQHVWPIQSPRVNVGESERAVSVAAGAILALIGVERRSIPGIAIASIGGAMLYRGITGHCHTYAAADINTAKDEKQLIHVEQAFTINRPADVLYRHWRNFEGLPQIMSHLQEVRVIDERRSHWIAKAPRIAGGTVEWDAEITRDEPNSILAWRSLDGSQIQTRGEIRFTKALGDRGTEMHVYMEYLPPAGKLGHMVATLFGEAPRRQMRDDLRNFKCLMETGEIPTIKGQPRGSCLTSGGRREPPISSKGNF